MKKILFIIESLNGGGAEKVLFDIIRNLDFSLYEIDLLLLVKEGIYLDKILKMKLPINIFWILSERKKIEKLFLYRKFKSLCRLLKEKLIVRYPNIFITDLKNKNYDVEIAFLEGESTVLLANRNTKAKKIAWVHIDLEKHRVLDKKTEKEAYIKMDQIICVSKQATNSIKKMYPTLEKKVKTIYNPIPKEEIIKLSLKEKNVLKKDKINIVTVGRLTSQKGYDILLQAHNKLLKEGYDYNLYILGKGLDEEKLRKYIEVNFIEKNTFLLGFMENPYPYIAEADIYVSSSRYEGYPLVVCEAICLGKPIIATDCTGPTEILENGKYGIIVKTENVFELKKAIKKLLDDKEIRKKYEILSKIRSKNLNMNKVLREIENLFQ